MGNETSDRINQKAAREEPAHYHGHRERLRERFHHAGPDALSDYELLEMALFAALPRRDTKPLAKALLKKFGSFAEVVHAPENLLREVDGIGDSSITQLKVIAAAAHRIAKGEIHQRALLSSWNEVLDYCRTNMGEQRGRSRIDLGATGLSQRGLRKPAAKDADGRDAGLSRG